MERQRRMERQAERDKERPRGESGCGLSGLQRATQVLPEDPSQLPLMAASRPWTGKTGDESGMGRSGGVVLDPRGSRYARQSQASWRVGHYQVLVND